MHKNLYILICTSTNFELNIIKHLQIWGILNFKTWENLKCKCKREAWHREGERWVIGKVIEKSLS